MPTLYQSQYPLAWPRHDWRQGTFRAPSILPIANLQDLQFWTCDATPDSPFSNFGNLFTILIRRELSTKLIHDHKNLTPPQVCLFEHWGPGRIRTLRQHIDDASKYHLQIVAKDRLFSSFANLLFFPSNLQQQGRLQGILFEDAPQARAPPAPAWLICPSCARVKTN